MSVGAAASGKQVKIIETAKGSTKSSTVNFGFKPSIAIILRWRTDSSYNIVFSYYNASISTTKEYASSSSTNYEFTIGSSSTHIQAITSTGMTLGSAYTITNMRYTYIGIS